MAAELVAQDVLEHVPSTKVMPALVEWNRIMAKMGVLRVRVPDLKSIAAWLTGGAPQEDLIQMLYGTQSYAGDFHMAGFTSELVIRMFHEAGFAPVSVDVVDGWLISAVGCKVRDVRSTLFEMAKDSRVDHLTFVTSVFARVLGRKVAESDVRPLVVTLENRVRDRYQIIKTVATSEEARSNGVTWGLHSVDVTARP